MPPKAPRRTAERIALVSLDLFNRYGEPHVSTTLISADLGISTGNLYYHFPSKDTLINHLHDQHEAAMLRLLAAGPDVRDVEDAWFFLHTWFETVWAHRFIYRDLTHLLASNRHLETRFGLLLPQQTQALRDLLGALAQHGVMAIDPASAHTLATSMTVLLTHWLSHEYVSNPRHALEPGNAELALHRGAQHVLHLLLPYMREPAVQRHLLALTQAYALQP